MIKNYKIAFYGFRHSHVNVLYKKVLERSDMTIAYLVEPNEKARTAASEKLGATFTDLTLDELLLLDFDILAVGTPYGERGEVIIKALESGKHVISDKPICTRKEELVRIKSLTQKHGLALACMLDLRYLPQTLRANEIIRSGELGEVRNVIFGGQHYIDPDNRPSWYFEEGMHGGTINDLAIHGVDLLRMLTGLEITEIDAARTWNSYAKAHPDFPDSAMFMARLSGGAGVLADVSYSAPSQCFTMPTYWEFRIFLEHGLISFCYAEPTVTVYKNGACGPYVLDGIQPKMDYVDELIHAIESGDTAITENVLLSTEATQKIQQIANKTN